MFVKEKKYTEGFLIDFCVHVIIANWKLKPGLKLMRIDQGVGKTVDDGKWQKSLPHLWGLRDWDWNTQTFLSPPSERHARCLTTKTVDPFNQFYPLKSKS